jgi:glycosyltransferase involved in cell wall biosynthesis
MKNVRVIAILAAYNEEDIIAQVVANLIGEGVLVYLIDDHSTDGTVTAVQPYLGKGLIGVESMPSVAGEENDGRFHWERVLRRKESLALELDADWFIHHDADEFRESPWPGRTLYEGIGAVDRLGYNAIDFAVLNFPPTHDEFRPGQDIRPIFRHHEPPGAFDRLQVKAWKQSPAGVDLTSSGGHDARFPGRRIFPVRFLLRHYPIRGQAHGERKVFADRVPRFSPDERARGWHVQYDGLRPEASFIRDPRSLELYDPEAVRLDLFLQNRPFEEYKSVVAADTAKAAAALETAVTKATMLEADLAGRSRDVAARDREVETLRAEVKQLHADRAWLGAKVAQRDEELAQLRTAGASRETEQAGAIEGLREEVKKLHGDRAWLGAVAEQREQAHSHAIEELTRELQSTRDQLRGYLGSISWRLTAPLRWVYDRLAPGSGGGAAAGKPGGPAFVPPRPHKAPTGAQPSGSGSEAHGATALELRAVAPAAPNQFLVLTHAIPTPDQDAGSVRMWELLVLLAKLGHHVTLIADSEERHPVHEAGLQRLGIPVIRGHSAALEHLAMAGHRYEHVMLSRPEVALRYLIPVRAHAVHAVVTYDTVDLHWVRMMRGFELTGDRETEREARHYRRVEQWCAAGSDVVLAATPSDRDALLADQPDLHVEVLPTIHPDGPGGAAFADRVGLMFIGGFWHQPNEDGICWFVEEIFPLIEKRIPGIELQIVGSNMTDRVRALDSATVHALGFVDDPHPLFNRSRVFVAPLRYGAGMKGKVGHSMSLGLPVVTTSIGAEGMDLTHGETALIADDPAGFAEAVVRLHADARLWQRISVAGRSHVAERFSPDAVLGLLRELYPTSDAVAGVEAGAMP